MSLLAGREPVDQVKSQEREIQYDTEGNNGQYPIKSATDFWIPVTTSLDGRNASKLCVVMD